jgi:formate dehydrogenase major subunit
MQKVTISFDGKPVEVDGAQTILEAALASGVYIPHLCQHPGLEPVGQCRLCLVEMADGRLMTACRVPVIDGMDIKTKSPAIDAAVRPTVELLIGFHHEKCAGCPAMGKCELQTVMARLKIDRRRVRRLRPPPAKRPVEHLNALLDYDPDRCILCGICLRTCEAGRHTPSLFYIGRGHEMKVSFYGDAEACAACLRCAERCPVGALMATRA